MSVISVTVGSRSVRTEALPFLPGLFVHRPTRRRAPPGTYNVTHARSGLAILRVVPERLLEVARMVVGKLTWDVPATRIYNDPRYKTAAEEVMAILNKNKSDSRLQEESIAADVGGKVQPGSGARWGMKRDVMRSMGPPR